MEKLIYVRHAKKGVDKNSEFVMDEGLDKAQELALGPLYPFIQHASHFFYGPMYRTLQTLLAMVTGPGMFGKVHEKIDLIGNTAMFDSWKKAGVKLGDRPNIEALREGLTPEQFETARKSALGGVIQMFTLMESDAVGLAVGHSPVIELAAEAAGFSMREVQLKENQPVIFTRGDDGAIAATLS